MPTIATRITSDRIRDLQVEDNTNIQQLSELLAQGGFDIAQAYVLIHRAQEKDALIGRVGSYKMKNGDAVEYDTVDISMPNAERRAVKAICDEVDAAKEAAKQCARACMADCGCSRKDNVSVSANNDTVRINCNGIVLDINIRKAD